MNTYTANYLLNQGGFTPPNNGATSSAVATTGTVAAVPDELQKTWNVLYSFSLCAYGPLVSIVDFARPASRALEIAASFAALAVEYLSQVFRIPVLAGNWTMKPSCAAGEEFNALVWYLQWLQ